jgi:hypothetical protein
MFYIIINIRFRGKNKQRYTARIISLVNAQP